MAYHLIPEPIRSELLQPNSVQVEQQQSGGLSGAAVWRTHSLHGPAALRRWPTEHPSAARLTEIHAAMIAARKLGQTCIPQIYCNRQGSTFSFDGQRLWELTQWMPGRAEYQVAATTGRLRAALQQLASLHNVWRECTAVAAARSPTLLQRCERLHTCLERLPGLLFQVASWRSVSQPLAILATDTLRQLAQRGPPLLAAAEKLCEQPVKQHFVLRDIWSEHVLFSADQVTGIIDFGAGRIDEPATDVARLLGSLEPLDRGRWQLGWDFYQQVNAHVDLQRVELLDRLATLLSAVQWLEWLVLDPREFDAPRSELLARWQRLLMRLETQPIL